jgi:hypothetical protein
MPIPPPALQLIRTQIGGSGSGGRGAVNNYPWPYGRRADRQWVVWGTGRHDRVLFGAPARLSARRAPPGLLLSVVPRCSSRARRPERVVGVFRELPAWSRLRRMSVRGVRCRVKGQRDIEHYRVGPCDTA